MPVSKKRADEKIREAASRIVAIWMAVLAALWPSASTIFGVPAGQEDKPMTKASRISWCQRILDIYPDIPTNLAITEQTPKDYLKEISVMNPELYAIVKDDLKAVRDKLKELKEGSTE